MPRSSGSPLALAAALAVLGPACAADGGDPLKKAGAASLGETGGTSGSSSSGSAGFGSSSSSGGGYGDNSSNGGGSEGSSSSGGADQSGSGGSTTGSSSGLGGGSSDDGGAGDDGGGDDAGGSVAPTGQCAPSSTSAQIGYYTTDKTTTATTQVSFDVDVTNGGFAQVNLSDLTIRYWFSADGNPVSGLTAQCDYASNGNATTQDITKSITMTFAAAPAANVTPTSDTYLQIAFGAAAGDVPSLSGTGATVSVRFYGGGYQDKFNEANDYSYDGTKTGPMYAQSKTITAYLSGQLVWGCEPGAAGASAEGSADAAAGGGATGDAAGD